MRQVNGYLLLERHKTISSQQVFDFSVSSADASDEAGKAIYKLLASGSTSGLINLGQD
jgi:hypothetical protein